MRITSYKDKCLKEAEQILDGQIKEMANDVVEIARTQVPVKSGKLRDSIHVEKSGNHEYAVGSDLDYALSVEVGTRNKRPRPYLVPALILASKKLKRK